LAEFLNPGPDRSPILYAKKVMFIMLHKSDKYIERFAPGRALANFSSF
jgi:hypothetical protein